MSLSDRRSGSELVCLCVRACGWCVCVCVSVSLRVSLGIYGGGRVGMLYIMVDFSKSLFNDYCLSILDKSVLLKQD